MPLDLQGINPLPAEININGVPVNGDALIHLLSMITKPDPKMWYRFEKSEAGAIIVHHVRDVEDVVRD